MKNLEAYVWEHYGQYFKTEKEVEAMTDAEYADYTENMIQAEQWYQSEGERLVHELPSNYWQPGCEDANEEQTDKLWMDGEPFPFK